MKKRKPVRAVIDTNLFVSGLFANQGYTYLLQELWVSGTFELAVSEKILAEVVNTLKKPQIRERLQLQDEETVIISDLIRDKATVVTADRYRTDKIVDGSRTNSPPVILKKGCRRMQPA